MTGKTETVTYAEIAPPPDENSFSWTATIHRKGRKRTETVEAFSEELVKERCRAHGVHRFVRA